MDYKRIYEIAAKIILSDTFTEERWKKYHEEHPNAKRENHTIVPNPPSTSHEEEHAKHTDEDKLKYCGIRRLLRALNIYFEKKIQKIVCAGHEYITPDNVKSADNGIDDAEKHVKEMRDNDIINQNNGVAVHITANDAKELIDCCITEGDYNLYQISALITSNIDAIFENSVYITRNESKPEKEERNKKKKRSVFLNTEIYNGACKINGEIFSVLFTIGISRFSNQETGKVEIKRRLYHFTLTNIKKLLPQMGQLSPGKQRKQPNMHTIKNWEKAKKHIVDLGNIPIH